MLGLAMIVIVVVGISLLGDYVESRDSVTVIPGDDDQPPLHIHTTFYGGTWVDPVEQFQRTKMRKTIKILRQLYLEDGGVRQGMSIQDAMRARERMHARKGSSQQVKGADADAALDAGWKDDSDGRCT